MKEVKTFFVSDNSLNKGYGGKNSNTQFNDNSKIKELLPSPDVLALYEEMNPGAFEKLVSMMQQEQKHRHAMDFAYLRIEQKARFIGKVFGLLILCIIGYVTIELSNIDSPKAMVFLCAAFATIIIASMIMWRSSLGNYSKIESGNINNIDGLEFENTERDRGSIKRPHQQQGYRRNHRRRSKR
jgi:uncharacterized membrane protein